ncbi:MAG: excinuclease ABC subunit C [Bacteroidetes bacterium]|nr:excinuclease ABC subunit C [Bacteroidota bacterium]
MPLLQIESIIKSLPNSPGIYQFFDADEILLYVGKAKDLKKRVSSYFNKEHDSGRLRLMVKKITNIKTTKVNTELDALLLENNLIKSLKPRYNINLRDDKTYPWIIIKREPFERVFYTRKKNLPNTEYFGPYASGKVMHTLLDIIRQTYPLRTCNYDLSEKNIQKHKFNVCLEYHIGRCKAPCAGKQSVEEYSENISQIRKIIKGQLSEVLEDLKLKMFHASDALKFEEAAILKEKIEILSKYQAKSTVVHPSITNVDVVNILISEESAYAHYFKIKSGAIINSQTIELKQKTVESESDVLLFAVLEFRSRYGSESKEVLLPFLPEIALPDCEFTIPKIGDKKHLLDLCYKNALSYKQEREAQIAFTDPDAHTNRIMQQMMKDLRMPTEPRRIEGFDNSNIQGHFAVSAMPVFINGKPARKEYRHFNVKTVVGPDDFETMREVIFRRYSRVLEEKLELPQLIVIDGGKGQLSAAVESLKSLGLYGKTTIIGIAKRLEEIYFPEDSIPLYLDKRSETLRIIQHIRDEAHRFGITHHRKKRGKALINSELNQIKGISKQTVQKLLIKFKSIEGIKNAEPKEIQFLIGKAKAGLVLSYLKKE